MGLKKGEKFGKETAFLTQKQVNFLEKYLDIGNKYEAYLATYRHNKRVKHNVIHEEIRRIFRSPLVQAYVERRRNEIAEKTDVNKQFIVAELLKVVVNHSGEAASLKALELLGRTGGMFWEIPARALPDELPNDNNIAAARSIHDMAQNGEISEGCAKNWLDMLGVKSSIEEKEGTNKEILEKLDKLNKVDENEGA